ncbi:MAG: GAF domain-containing sensor histidine kinase [Sediminispirochaetaceae bacterium]
MLLAASETAKENYNHGGNIVSEKKDNRGAQDRHPHIEYRLALEKIIGDASRRFVNSPLTHISDEIDTVLRKMGEFARVDRSYIFLFSEDGKSMSNTHEWCAPGVEPQMDKLQELQVDEFPWIVRKLKEGYNISIADLEELPPEASGEKEILRMQDIQSIAAVPMKYGGELKGYLGFDSTKEQLRWNPEDFSLLHTMGDIIISALVRLRMEKQLLQSYKMEAIGRFAGGIAHDFNNILTSIKGNIQLLAASPSLDKEEKEIVEALLLSAESGHALTGQLLNFSNNKGPAHKMLSLNEVLKGSLQMLQQLIPENITVKTRFQTENDSIKSDRSQIEQIVMNLIKNSVDAMPGGGQITLRTRNVEFQDTDLIRGSGVIPGKYLLIQVSDNGCGMSKSTREKALEPFFTTKETGRGSGIGLSNVYTILRQNSGYIEIDSAKNKGTTIDIYLPV